MELANLAWTDVEALERDVPVVIPVAALEQHGRHLPLFTDSMITGVIARRADEALKDHILLVPLLWLGNSHHHVDFPGTVSAQPRVWIDVLGGIVDNFITHGFRRIVVLNGHGGNEVPGRQAMFEIRQRYRDRRDLLLLFATYWDLVDSCASIPGLQQSRMGHACEWETSMILYLAPSLVRNHKHVPAVDFGNPFLPAQRAWITLDRSASGHVGAPDVATPEKGEQLLHLFTDGTVKFIQRVIRWDGNSWEG